MRRWPPVRLAALVVAVLAIAGLYTKENNGVVSGLFGVALLAFTALLTPSFWAGRLQRTDTSNFLAPPIINRGMNRQLHLIGLLAGVTCLSLALLPVAGAAGWAVWLVWFAVALVVMVQFLFNWPRFLVPPRYRSQLGFLAEARQNLTDAARR